jgi:DNA repair exonuclease SbcCD ATPase subunit
MAFNVMDYLRPRKQAKVVAIAKLASQLHKGEAVDPDVILHSLHQAGGTEEQLQAEIDRLERVARLRQQIAEGGPAQKRLDVIDAEISKAADKLQAAALEVQRLREKHFAEGHELRAKLLAAEDGASKLLEADNLAPGDRDAWQYLQAATVDAHEAHSISSQDLQHATARLRDAEEHQPEAKERARLQKSNQDAQDDAKRWENALAARTTQLQEAKAQLVHTAQAVADAEAAEAKFRADILGGTR